MIRILQNYLPDSSTRVITEGTAESVYQIIPIPNELRGQTVSLSFESEVLAGNPPSQHLRVRDTVSNTWSTPLILETLPPEGRVVWENINIPTYSEFAFYIYNGIGSGHTLGNDFARWNMHLAIGEKASDIWTPHRDDLNEAQATLMPEHLFGGGYRLEGDSSDIASKAGWQYEGIAQSIVEQQEYHFTSEQQYNQQLCEDTRRRKCLQIYSDFRHRNFELHINISDRFSRTNYHNIFMDTLISRFKASLLARSGREPATTKRCLEKIEFYFNGWRKREIARLGSEGYAGRRLHRREGRIYRECGSEPSRHMASSIRGFTARKTTTLPAIRDLFGNHVNLAPKGVMA